MFLDFIDWILLLFQGKLGYYHKLQIFKKKKIQNSYYTILDLLLQKTNSYKTTTLTPLAVTFNTLEPASNPNLLVATANAASISP